jgi:hypothetical protein
MGHAYLSNRCLERESAAPQHFFPYPCPQIPITGIEITFTIHPAMIFVSSLPMPREVTGVPNLMPPQILGGRGSKI